MTMIKTRDGIALRVKQWGSGRPVILMHGGPLSADSWDDQAMAITDAGMSAIAYDRRGFGHSDQPWTGYDYDTLADDLADVMKVTNVTDASIVGFSMGGGEVARYMSRHGGAGVKQAALISSVVPFMLKTDDNPNGTPQSTFDDMTECIDDGRIKGSVVNQRKCFFEFARYGDLETGIDDQLFKIERKHRIVLDNKDSRALLLIDWHLMQTLFACPSPTC